MLEGKININKAAGHGEDKGGGLEEKENLILDSIKENIKNGKHIIYLEQGNGWYVLNTRENGNTQVEFKIPGDVLENGLEFKVSNNHIKSLELRSLLGIPSFLPTLIKELEDLLEAKKEELGNFSAGDFNVMAIEKDINILKGNSNSKIERIEGQPKREV